MLDIYIVFFLSFRKVRLFFLFGSIDNVADNALDIRLQTILIDMHMKLVHMIFSNFSSYKYYM